MSGHPLRQWASGPVRVSRRRRRIIPTHPALSPTCFPDIRISESIPYGLILTIALHLTEGTIHTMEGRYSGKVVELSAIQMMPK